MCHASQDDGYLVFEDLVFQFRGILDEDKLKNNLEFLEEKRFINQVNLVNLLIPVLMVGIEIIIMNQHRTIEGTKVMKSQML